MATGITRAETVFSNLNTNPSASVGSGFTWFAQRFTTVSAGTGLDLDLNIIAQAAPQTYSVELWSANLAGDNVDALLASIGSGVVSSTDKTAITSFTLPYSLTAATDYFVKIVCESGTFAWVLGPSSSATLDSLVRYGVGNLNNNTTSVATAMAVDVAAVPEPTAFPILGLVGLAWVVGWRTRLNRRDRVVAAM